MKPISLKPGIALAFLLTSVGFAGDEILVADFEQETYREWKVEGDAFGPGPAEGTLPGQMAVSGYKGKRLVNTFHRGDGTTGTLTSPALRIERDYLSFLIGGGGHEGKTAMNLLLDGKVVESATGPNTEPGGSEQLELQFWDVRPLRGKTVTLEIVDKATGGWGHINVDHIIQTDEKPDVPSYRQEERTFTVAKPYLVLPIKNGAKKTLVALEVEGKPVRRYETELAVSADDVDWYAYFTLEAYQGKSARLNVSKATTAGFELIRQADHVPGSENWYEEELRPHFHFSQQVGWNNDPNGMVYLDGEWHLYFQHNPVGWNWGNMTWGHAVSKDLIHWKQLPNVLFPHTMAKGACFSGGAVIDRRNSAGWKTGKNDVLVAFLTDTGAGESLAYSNDKGRTFTWYEGNPVVKHQGRDPKVIWYAYEETDTPLDASAKEKGGHWVMAVYDEHPEYKQNIAFYTSTDLKDWKKQSHLPGYFECPELFELPVDGKADDSRWVIFAADARYALGTFDGRKFTPEHEGKHQVHYGPYYASQTFENTPDGRRIQMGWVQIAMPGMPFNQTFSFPTHLTLRETRDGIRLFAKPIEEIETLHQKKRTARPQELNSDSPVSVDVSGKLFDIRATFEVGTAKEVGLDVGGNRIVYDNEKQQLNNAPLKPEGGRVSMQVLADRPMIEITGNEGAVLITSPRASKGQIKTIRAFAKGQGAKLISLEVYELKSIWK